MKRAEEETLDPQIEQLLDWDEALARSPDFTLSVDRERPRTATPNLLKGLACLEALQQLRPKARQSVHDFAIDSTSDLLLPKSNGNVTAATFTLAAGLKFGRFEVIRELGRGGFGVVFLAKDPTLHREVALKLPHAQALATTALRERFFREARAAARLTHPNIVVVYEAGEVGPVCYIASAFCDGPNLADWLHRRREPVPFAEIARLTRQMAEAVAYAHSQDILHRDLKPANILLSGVRNQESGTKTATRMNDPWLLTPDSLETKITDFSLAKIVGAGEEATASGTLIGTPRYMAPEQASGKPKLIGPWTDVYALGTILYELLTGRPAFQGENEVDTLQQVVTREPVEPRLLRPGLPRDLQTICLRCLQKDPKRRYPSAAALADDLRRFQEGEPIKARPVGAVERLVRWCRRRPAIAGLSAALVGLSLLCLIVVVGLSLHASNQASIARTEKKQAETERNTAREQEERARQNYQQAHDSLRRFTTVGLGLFKDPKNIGRGREILQEALTQYEQLLREPSANADVRYETAQLANQVGRIHNELGQLNEGVAAFRQARELYDSLLEQEPTNTKYLIATANNYFDLARLYYAFERWSESEAAFQTALRVTDQRLSLPSAPATPSLFRAVIILNLSSVYISEKRYTEARPLIEEAVRVLGEAHRRDPNNLGLRLDYVLALESVAYLVGSERKFEESEKGFKACLELLAAYPGSTGSEVGLIRSLARNLDYLGRVQRILKKYDEAEASWDKSLAYTEQAVAALPHSPQVLGEYIHRAEKQAEMQAALKRPERALETYRRTQALRNQMVEEAPNHGKARISFVRMGHKFTRLLIQEQRPDEALGVYQEIAHHGRLAVAKPEATEEWWIWHLRTFEEWADLCLKLKRWPELRDVERQWLAEALAYVQQQPGEPAPLRQAIKVYEQQTKSARAQEDWPAAAAAAQEALRTQGQAWHLSNRQAADGTAWVRLLNTWLGLYGTGRLAPALLDRAQVQAALELGEHAMKENQFDPAAQASLAAAYILFGDLSLTPKDEAEAERVLRRGIGLYEAIREAPNAPRGTAVALARARDKLTWWIRQYGEDIPEALDLLREVQREFPRSFLLNDYCWMLVLFPELEPDRLPEAYELSLFLTSQDPQQSYLWNTLALACYRLGRYSEAEAALARAHELNQHLDATDWLVTGLLHAQAGRRSEAQAALATADFLLMKEPKVRDIIILRAELLKKLNRYGQTQAP